VIIQWQDKRQWAQTELQANLSDCKKTLTVWVVRHRDRLPEEAVDSPSLKISKTQLDTALSNLLYLILL